MGWPPRGHEGTCSVSQPVVKDRHKQRQGDISLRPTPTPKGSRSQPVHEAAFRCFALTSTHVGEAAAPLPFSPYSAQYEPLTLPACGQDCSLSHDVWPAAAPVASPPHGCLRVAGYNPGACGEVVGPVRATIPGPPRVVRVIGQQRPGASGSACRGGCPRWRRCAICGRRLLRYLHASHACRPPPGRT